ncbi:MAG TPA: ABC transporter substrate-binding protein [Ramlibacter sp.]|nr:ABC transporter substrate-binding protein [Ramlibacter sp.]
MQAKFKRLLTPLAALALAVPLVAGAQQQGVTDAEIVLGEIVPLTGAASVGSVALSLGTKLAVAEANAAGGVNGRRIRVISEDDGYVVTRAVQAARKLVTGDKVFALANMSGSAPSVALLPMLKQVGIPAVNVLSFPDSLHTPVVPNIWVAGASHQDSVEALATELNKRFPDKKWAVVTQDDELGSLMREGWDRAQAKLKLNAVYKASYRRGQKDFSAEMLAATRAGAEILLAGGIVTENIAMVKELERLGSRIPVGATWIGRYPAVLQALGPAADNFYMIDYVAPEGSATSRAFYARAAKFLSEDELKRTNRYTPVGYAGTKVLIEAMRRCGKQLTWACAIKEMDNGRNFETSVMAPLSFTAGNHFSRQKLALMKANPKTLEFEPLQ